MTTSFKLRTNGPYVSEARNSRGEIIGSAGPGSNVESEWINYIHGDEDGVKLLERNATDEEKAALAAAASDADDTVHKSNDAE